MELSTIAKEDFETLGCGEGWTEFKYKEELYRLKLSGHYEIIMSVFAYGDV